MHVAIIVDGNARPATGCGLPHSAAQVEGKRAVRILVDAAAREGVDTLTLYAFCTDNSARSPLEADALMQVFRGYLIAQAHRSVEQLVRIHVIGPRDRFPEHLVRTIERSEQLSVGESRMSLRIVFDYSSHDSIVRAAWRANSTANLTPEEFYRRLDEVDPSALAAGPVDLLIRPDGVTRLSHFMLWECAYAELHFVKCLWPHFGEERFLYALDDYASRQRRFGTYRSEDTLAFQRRSAHSPPVD